MVVATRAQVVLIGIEQSLAEEVIHQALVHLYALAGGSSGDKGIHKELLRVARHHIGHSAGDCGGKHGPVQVVHQFNGGVGLLAIVHLIFEHTHEAVILHKVVEYVCLGIAHNLRGRVFHHSVRSVLVEECVAVEVAAKEPLLVGHHIVNEEAHSSLLLLALHKGECGHSVAHGGALQINSAHIGHNVIEVVVPLVHNGILQARSLVVGLVLLAGSGPGDDVVHGHLQVVDAASGGINCIVAKVFTQGAWVHGIARRLRLAVSVERPGVSPEQSIEVLALGLGTHCAIPAVAILNGKQVVGANAWRELRHSVAGLGYVVVAGIVHD